MAKLNLRDYNFNSETDDAKRLWYVMIHTSLKELHSNNKRVKSFELKDIYYDDETKKIEFANIADINTLEADSKEQAIIEDLKKAATLAFCSFLKTYDPKNGLLDTDTIIDQYPNFTYVIPMDDREYYNKILSKNPQIIYYSDYVINRFGADESTQSQADTNKILVFTARNQMMPSSNKEAAFSTQFFLASMVACTMLVVVGYIIYLFSVFS